MVVDESSELKAAWPVRLRGVSRRQSCLGGGQSIRNAADRPLHRLAGGGHPDDPVYQLCGRDGQSFPGVCLLGAGTTAAGNGGTAGVTRPVCQRGLKVVYLILAAIMLCCLPLVPAFPPALSADVGLFPPAARGHRDVNCARCWRSSRFISASARCGLYRHHRQRGGIDRGANWYGALAAHDGVRHYRRGQRRSARHAAPGLNEYRSGWATAC